jgi:hypothetical protein
MISSSKVDEMKIKTVILQHDIEVVKLENEKMKSDMLNSPKFILELKDKLKVQESKLMSLPELLQKRDSLRKELQALKEKNSATPEQGEKKAPELQPFR